MVIYGWHAFTRPSETWRSREKSNRPRVGMFAAGRHAFTPRPWANMPTRGRLRLPCYRDFVTAA